MLPGLAAAPLGPRARATAHLAPRLSVMKDLRPPPRPDASDLVLHRPHGARPLTAPHHPPSAHPPAEPTTDFTAPPAHAPPTTARIDASLPAAPDLSHHAEASLHAPRVATPDHAEALALAQAAAAGDRPAAAALARRLLPVARRVTRALLGAAPDADDATQAALLELLQSAHTYAGQGPLEAWARRIVARTTLRALRRARRLPLDPLDEDAPLADLPAPTSDLRDHLPRALDDYLALLPESQRIALVLRHALGHTLPEIADLTGAPVPTIKSRVLKAEATLRKLIRRDQNLGRSAP